MKHVLVSVALFFFVCLNGVVGHMCMLSPTQRGPLSASDINVKNTAHCGWSTAACGGLPAQTPSTYLVRDTTFTVIWQKNENHWYQNAPGSFNLSYADVNTPTNFVPIYSFEDTNSDSLTLYTYSLDVGKLPAGSKQGILQLVYYCPGIKVNYYACADLMVVQ